MSDDTLKEAHRWIDEFLAKIDAQGGPTPISLAEEYRRLEMQMCALAEMATTAAEVKFPGFVQQCERIIRRMEEIAPLLASEAEA